VVSDIVLVLEAVRLADKDVVDTVALWVRSLNK
jgi:uncharacterized LabA/DUF88 family protein